MQELIHHLALEKKSFGRRYFFRLYYYGPNRCCAIIWWSKSSLFLNVRFWLDQIIWRNMLQILSFFGTRQPKETLFCFTFHSFYSKKHIYFQAFYNQDNFIKHKHLIFENWAWYHQFVGFSEFQESVESKKHVPEMKSKNAFLTMSSPRNVHMYMFSSSFLRLLNDRNDY